MSVHEGACGVGREGRKPRSRDLDVQRDRDTQQDRDVLHYARFGGTPAPHRAMPNFVERRRSR